VRERIKSRRRKQKRVVFSFLFDDKNGETAEQKDAVRV